MKSEDFASDAPPRIPKFLDLSLWRAWSDDGLEVLVHEKTPHEAGFPFACWNLVRLRIAGVRRARRSGGAVGLRGAGVLRAGG